MQTNNSLEQYPRPGSIDQLWYTWSSTGLESLSGEFRIRAATLAFKLDLYGERMRSLAPYLLYKLPQDTDRFELATALEQAPINLTFVKTDLGEKVLAYKVYTGRDGYNRQGVHFVHLLAGLPDYFSVEDAISLWRSQFWQTCDLPASRQGVDLNPLDIKDLQACEKPIPQLQTTLLNSQKMNINRVYENLPLVINAYLAQVTKLGPLSRESAAPQAVQVVEPKVEGKKHPRPKTTSVLNHRQYPALFSEPGQPQIYLIAPPDEVAFYVSVLTTYLKPLLAPLTFSTYEHDVRSKPQCFLVGTCPEPSLAQIDHAERGSEAYHRLSELLPRPLPSEAIAINCYTQESSSFDLPQYAEDFSEYICQKLFEELPASDTNGVASALQASGFVTSSLLTTSIAQMTREELAIFMHDMIQKKQITVSIFLDKFYHQVLNRVYSQADCEEFLANDEKILLRFGGKNVCEQFAEHLANDPAWIEQKLLPLLESAFDRSVQNNQLLSILSKPANEVLKVANETIKQTNADRFQGPIKFLLLAVAHNPALVRGEAVRQCLAQANHTVLSEWNQRRKLLLQVTHHARALHGNPLIDTLLDVEESHFADLLTLNLPAEWNRRATHIFLATTSSGVRPQTITSLEAAFSYVQALVQQLHTACNDRDIAHKLYRHLVGNKLSSAHKMALLLQTWLSLSLTTVELDSLLLSDDVSRLNTDERAHILALKGFHYLCQGVFSDIMLALYERVVRAPDGESRYKTSLLPALVGVGSEQHGLLSEPVLTRLLTIARLHSQTEATSFFNQCELKLSHGSYIEQYPNLESLIHLYEKAPERYEQKMELLDRWFQARSLSRPTAERLLRATPLSLSDKAALIMRHAMRFRSSELFGLIIQLFTEVAQDDYKNIYLWQILDLLLKLGLQSRELESILIAANLKQGTRAMIAVQLFQTYGRVNLPAIYLSLTALDLFAWLNSHAWLANDEEPILKTWFSDILHTNRSTNSRSTLEGILLASSLAGEKVNPVQEQRITDLRASIFRDLGEALLLQCSESNVVQVQIKQYLRYFDVTHLASSRHLTSDALFLDKLNEQATRLSSDAQSLMQCWLHIREIVNRPSIEYIDNNEQCKKLAATFYTLVKHHSLPHETRVLLIGKLAEAFSTLHFDSEHFLLSLASLLADFLLNERFEFFYLMAELTREEFKKKRQSNILMPYIKTAPYLDLYPREAITKDELRRFTYSLWNHLLTTDAYEMLKQKAQTQKWEYKVQVAWNDYVQTIEREQKERKLQPVPVPTTPSVAQTVPTVPLGQPVSVASTNATPPSSAMQPALTSSPEPPARQWSWPILSSVKARMVERTIDRMLKLLGEPGMRTIARYNGKHREVIVQHQDRFTDEQWNHIRLATDFDVLCKKVDQYRPPRREDAEALVKCKEFIMHIFPGTSLQHFFTQGELDRLNKAENHTEPQRDNQETSASYYGTNVSDSRKHARDWITDEIKGKKRKKKKKEERKN